MKRRYLNQCLLLLVPGLMSTVVTSEAAVDSERGAEIFDNNCVPCHTHDQNAVIDMFGASLNLYGVIGRTAGSTEGFYFTDAMINSGIVWDEANLKEFLKNPQEYIPGNAMGFSGMENEQDREDILSYFMQLTDG